MKKAFIILGIMGLILGGVIIFALYKKRKANAPEDYKKYIMASAPGDTTFAAILNRMTAQELKDSYELVKFTNQGKKPTDPALINRLTQISSKYKIFT